MENRISSHCFTADLKRIAPVRDAYAGRLFPKQQLETFQKMRHAFPTRLVASAQQPSEFNYQPVDFSHIGFTSNGKRYDLFDLISRNRITGLLIVQNNTVRLEHYDFGFSAHAQWMSMSMAKSISTTLVGIAIKQGAITSIDDKLVRYLPKLKNTSYAAVTIRQLLLMTSGVRWNEDHTNPKSERREVLELQLAQRAGSICDYMGQLPRLHQPGNHWNYSTGETHLVGELLYAATGCWLSDYLSTHLWQPIGMEQDAYWWLESTNGLEIAGSGLNACLRDYARFGCFMANGGVIDGHELLPKGWCDEAAGPTSIGNESVPYGYMWWSVPSENGQFSQKAFCARGIFGQRIYINPTKKLVIVTTAARAKPMYDDVIADNDFFNAVGYYLENYA